MTFSHLTKFRVLTTAAWVVSLCTVGTGCSNSVAERVIVHGLVTYQDEPISDGTITLLPTDPATNKTLAAEIKEGHYEISSDVPSVNGKYRVEIQAYRKTGREIPNLVTPNRNTSEGGMMEEKVPFLPGRFNSQSKLTAEINTENPTIDFAL